MRCLSFLPAVLMFSMGTASAQSLGEIRGRVLDAQGAPLVGASITTSAADRIQGTAADEDGRFVLKPLPPGVYTVQVSFLGFQSIEIPGVEVTDRANYLADLRMKDATELRGHEVIGYKRRLIEPEDPSRQTLLASEFKHDPNIKNPVQFIGKSFAGVTPTANGDGLYFRGSRTENMASYLDGVKMSGVVPRVPPSAISSVSVYTGGLPARYGDVTGGVVVIETKTYSEMYEQARALRLRQEHEATDQPE
ncbi:MAG: TonB-dependent receptor [Flavobacteriales bacterium]